MIGLILITSCQTGFERIQEIDDELSFNSESLETETLRKITLLDGSDDNILDAASCIQVKLPVNITIEEKRLSIRSSEDFILVENELNRIGYTSDEIDFEYPINIILWDYREITITSEEEFESWADGCVNDGSDEDIECVDIVYPIEISGYVRETESTESFIFSDDKSLFQFMENIPDDEILSIQFPIEFISQDKIIFEANTNSDILQIANENGNNCDEKDVLFRPIPDPLFLQYLTNSAWYIDYFFDEFDLTNTYSTAKFEFLNTGQIALAGSSGMVGEWLIKLEDNKLVLAIEFDSESPYESLSDEWEVFKYNSQQIVLQNENRFLVLHIENSPAPNEIEAILSEEKWIFSSYIINNEDETEDYQAYSFEFNSDGSFILFEEIEILSTGSWYPTTDDYFIFSVNEESEFSQLNGIWNILEYNTDQVTLQLTNEEDELDITIVLSRI